jgi:hypothetical protein
MLPALVVGALTAWYLGLKAGIIAAAVSFAALIVAAFIPGATITVYALVIGWCVLLYLAGSRLNGGARKTPSMGSAGGVAGFAGSAIGTVGKWVGKAKAALGSDKR